MAAGNIGLTTVWASLLVILLVEAALSLFLSAYTAYPMAVLGLARVTEAVAITQIVRHFNEVDWIPWSSASWFVSGLKRGLIWSAGFGLIAAVICLPLLAFGTNPLGLFRAPMPTSTVDVILLFLVGGVMSPVAEEIFFRGVLYGFFRRWGIGAAIVLSTLLFAMVHAGGSQIPLTQLIGGAVFAIAYEKEGNLMVPTTIHILGNTAIFSISYGLQLG